MVCQILALYKLLLLFLLLNVAMDPWGYTFCCEMLHEVLLKKSLLPQVVDTCRESRFCTLLVHQKCIHSGWSREGHWCVWSWMAAHKLMMNQEKTIIMQLISQNNIFTGAFSISGANIPVSPVARNLGVLRDSWLSMKARVNQICHTPHNAHQQRQCNLQDADQGGCRDTGACLHKWPAGLLQLLVVWAASFHPQQTPPHVACSAFVSSCIDRR